MGREDSAPICKQNGSMFPRHLALIDGDAGFAESLAQFLRERGIDVTVFGDGNTLLADGDPRRFDFYLVDPMLPGMDGVELIKILRHRSDAGILVLSARPGSEVFASVLQAGADMHLAKPVQGEQVALAVQAVQRRAGRSAAAPQVWKLDRRARELLVPDGSRVALSDADLVVLECFLDSAGEPVTRETLSKRLGRTRDDDGDDRLNAIIYRLRRRIERATPMLVPLQSRSRVGYVFRAPLARA
jgi:DNA-binding response OmpR family regulator